MYRTLSFLCCLLLPVGLFALPSDSEQKIHITADSQLFNYRTGINTYEGNVKIDQGTQLLLADKVITKSNSEHKMIEATAYGIKQLAKYSTLPKMGDAKLQAQAKIIKFYPPTFTIVLEGDVTVTQGENSFNGEAIIYNIKEQTISAPASKLGRATITLESDKLKS